MPARRTLLAAVLLLATVASARAQTLFDDTALISGEYGFAGGYGSYTEIPAYVDVPAYYGESPAPVYGYHSYGYNPVPTYPPTYFGDSPAPQYYYTYGYNPAPIYGYGYDAPTYYYSTAPTTPFYYTTETTTPFYYTTAPTTPFYYSTPTPAPATCPPCPTCSASYVAPTTAAAAPTAGTCYCPYDSDWKTWAVTDPTCRTALYSKCKADSRLPCTWLDQYYSATTAPSTGFTRPHEQQIFAYLYSDCAPAPPCACSPLTFTSADPPAQVYTCCRQLQTYSQIPYSGLSQTVADAYCSSGARASDIKAWVTHALWHATCPAAATSTSAVYTTTAAASPSPATASTSTAKAATTAPVSAIQPQASAVQSAADRRAKRRRTAVVTAAAAAGGVVGGALLAAAAALVVLHLRRPRHEGVYHAV